MKPSRLIMFFLVILSEQLLAQPDKYTVKLNAYYDNADYDQVIKFKKSKTDQLQAKALYYKAMAYYMTEDDQNALRLMNMAIEKGPIDHDMFYYKAMTLAYMEKFEEAIPNFDKAISLLPTEPSFYSSKGQAYYHLSELDSARKYYKLALDLDSTDPDVYVALGTISLELSAYHGGIEAFQTALSLMKLNTTEHQNCSFNIALAQQLGNLPEEAKLTLRKHLVHYPDDYSAVSKLIQIHYSLDEIDETDTLRSLLGEAYKSGSLPSHMSEMYCFDQFDWNSRRIFAFESYEDYKNEILIWKHKFLVLDSVGEIAYSVQTILDSTLASSQPKKYYLHLIKDDTISAFAHYTYEEGSDYVQLREAVLDVLNREETPVYQQGDFANWLSTKEGERFGELGNSFENAISVKSISEEYAWLRRNYAGFTFLQQSLVFDNGKPYDVLKIITSTGKTKSIYFDISSFFGKGF